MPAKSSHTTVTALSVFIPIALALHSSCAAPRSQPLTPIEHEARIVSSDAVNINTANVRELQSIPGVGPALAKKIIDHREHYGPFRKPAEILIVDGISEKRFREFRRFIVTE